MRSHLELPKSGEARIEMKYYPAGHMMYIHEPSLKAFKADVGEFLDRVSRPQEVGGGRRFRHRPRREPGIGSPEF